MSYETIGNRIQSIIKDQNISQKNFAESVKADPTHINKILKGKSNPSDSLMYLICERYGINFDWLKQGTGEKHTAKNSKLYNDALEIFNSLDDDLKQYALAQLNELYKLQEIKYSKSAKEQ